MSSKSKVTAFDWINNLNESNLGLNNKVQKKFDKADAVENVGEFVDLGMPSGIQWRKYNLGSFSDSEIGDYFNYREVKEIAKKNKRGIDIPNRGDFMELKENCEIQELPEGLKYTSKINQKSIMFKHTGYFWNDDFTFDHELPCGLWWSFSDSWHGSSDNISLRPFDEPLRKWDAPMPRVFSVFETNGYDHDADKFCIRPILRPKASITNESSLGLNKKVSDKYKNKTTEDVIEDMFTAEAFKKELIEYAIKRCKIKRDAIETSDLPERSEICFDMGDHEQVYFIIAKEGLHDVDKKLENHFGLFMNDSAEGEQFAAYLINSLPSDDCEIVNEYSHNFFMTRVMYRICQAGLESAKETLKWCKHWKSLGNSLCFKK